MFARKNIAGEVETRQRLSAVADNLRSFAGFLVLGFPVAPATIRTTLATWVLVVLASLQLVFKPIAPRLRQAFVRRSADGGSS